MRKDIIAAGYVAVEQLIEVAKENVLKVKTKTNEDGEDEDYSLAADRLKNAAATKKLAIFDAFEILARIDGEQTLLDQAEGGTRTADNTEGFAERRSASRRNA